MKKLIIKSLSVKLTLVLFGIAALVAGVTFAILRAFEVRVNEMMFVVYTVVPIALLAIALLLAYVIHKMLIKRIRKLNDAAKQVASGSLDTRLEVKGSDELAQLAETFNNMTAELKANEYLSKEFVRNVSHEFKTPISSVKAYAELVESEAAKPKPRTKALKEYSGIIIEQCDRLAQLTRSILQLSLLDNTTIIKKDDGVCPAGQIRSILRLTQTSWENKNLKLDLQLEDFTIKSNSQLAYQVWQNLISNAIKFSEQNGTITIVLQKNGDGLCFSIRDTGIGINDGDKEKIFEQFFTADKSRNTEGSGLGLPIVKKILDKLGGTVECKSEAGKGTVFTVKIQA